ncbi:MAG: glycogen debranching enzyme GlgX, partial [Hydrogenophaga sp.]|nr:glycogen debranching enzyme GlgX [Hydrogenophaga sp.]
PAHSSVNYLTAHDGFTLMDLVSYVHRHNEANGEGNRDGHGHNLSVNHGVEGPSDDPTVQAARLRQRRALLAVLLLSLGTPMLLAGDELGHSQQGNNNAYCQDNPSTWLHWDTAGKAAPGLTDFVAQLIALRQSLAPLRGHWWRSGPSTHPGTSEPLARWFQPNGDPLGPCEWEHSHATPLLLQLDVPGLACLLLLNPTNQPHRVVLPPGPWQRRLDTHSGATEPLALAATVELPAGSVWLAVQPGTF